MVAYAASGTVGNSAVTMNKGETKDIVISLITANDVQAVGGTVAGIVDTSCVQVNRVTEAQNVSLFNNKFAIAAMSALPSNTKLLTVNVTGLKACETTFAYQSDIKVTSTSAQKSPATISAGTIKVVESTPTPSSSSQTPDPGPTTKSNNNDLASLTVSSGELSPAFSAGTRNYSVTVDNSVTSITVTARKYDSKATIDHETVTKNLEVGSNTVNITVTAEDGNPKTYTVTIYRKDTEGQVKGETDQKDGDTSLKSLDVSGYTLTPTFNPNTKSYSMNVGNNITALKVNATANSAKSTVSVRGNSNFQVGMNTIYITVTAENGSTATYTVNVKRAGDGTETAQKSTNNYLSNILVGNGELSPEFNKETQTYSIKVDKDVTSLDLKAFAEDSKATVEVLGNTDFQVGANTVTVKVTAEDGSVRMHTLNVNKVDQEAKNKLQNIIIRGQTSLNPKFDPDTTYYDAEVSGGTKSINITGITDNPNAKIEYIVNGETQENGKLKLQEGYNLVAVKVTDENGLTRYYYINVYRADNSFNLFGLKIPKWLGYLLIGLGILLFLLLLFFLFKRRKDEDDDDGDTNIKIDKKSNDVVYPKIEFKPEFNFGSKNSDNDTVSEGAVLNQESSKTTSNTEDNDDKHHSVNTRDNKEEVPYDPYDEIVTVDEIIDAIDEKDPKKLRILYEQEMLNRKKEELQKESNSLKHAKRDDSDED